MGRNLQKKPELCSFVAGACLYDGCNWLSSVKSRGGLFLNLKLESGRCLLNVLLILDHNVLVSLFFSDLFSWGFSGRLLDSDNLLRGKDYFIYSLEDVSRRV